ncbi:MAG: DUF2752 domain-containing protein [Planctomycetota bacterium]|jgi:hypothetical protein
MEFPEKQPLQPLPDRPESTSPDDAGNDVAAGHPLGALVLRFYPDHPFRARLIAFAVLAAGLVLFGTAIWLKPSEDGLGTHRQLGLPPCSSIALFGLPCPTCGMTTAFALAVRGKWMAAFQAQPAGLLLAIAALIGTTVSGISAISGAFWHPNWYRISIPRWTIGLLVLILCGWGYKLLAGFWTGELPVR